MLLGKLVSATARPLNAATGATAVLVAVFGVLSEFNVGLSEGQQSALVLFFAILGQWVVGLTGSDALRRIIGDPNIPSIEPGDPVPVRALRNPLTTAPAPEPGGAEAKHRIVGERAPEPEGPWT